MRCSCGGGDRQRMAAGLMSTLEGKGVKGPDAARRDSIGRRSWDSLSSEAWRVHLCRCGGQSGSRTRRSGIAGTVDNHRRYELVPSVGRRRALGAVPSKARREVVPLGACRCDARCVRFSRRGQCVALRFLLLRLVTRLHVLRRRLVLRLLLLSLVPPLAS